jgi:RNA polymerase sigma factor (sigma-70 family)
MGMGCNESVGRPDRAALSEAACVGDSLDTWFAREILSHEAALIRYLTRAWFARDEIHDMRQEVYLRVYEAAAKALPHSPKAFLFTTARHLIADRVRRKRIVSIESGWDCDALDVLVDEISPERRTGAHQELSSLARAFDLLPPRCREVVWMRRVEERSQKEVAAQLGIGEAMVEKHIAKAMRRLADALFGCHFSEAPTGEANNPVREDPYGRQHRN